MGFCRPVIGRILTSKDFWIGVVVATIVILLAARLLR